MTTSAVLRLLAVAAVLVSSACATSPAPAEPRSVVTLGDSVAAGAACGCDPFPALYARAQHATDVDLAQDGATAADVRAGLNGMRDELSSAAEVVIMIGANDMAGVFGQPARYATVADGVEADVAATVTTIRRGHRIPVVVLGYWNVVQDGQVAAEAYGADGVRDAGHATALVNQALRTAAERTGATFVPTEPAFHGDDGGRDPTGLLAPDGDHPNAAGQAAIAALIPPLRK
ncbi:SGNH/GDSL hydrolase family protein [Actinoplanes sp. TRM 88003]|uniref:SGNH/GDSL hydrolase family protein n=1 Tax=Paractinoplanes aksuensis TaxID=2939490 RepID=A0ABT1DYQ3_9ACTN|nr:SGNH/GDSL hydrolase family protein [Actinoplanes aksuensis]MCO8275989.1 SGNH/GDSL hydrolase family protein [Actinoplanes aksuensis]